MSYLLEGKKKISVLLNTREDVLCNGGAKDYPSYTRIVGELTGLKLAIQELDDLQKRIDRNNGDIDEDRD